MASEFFRSAAVPVENTRSPAGSGPVSEDERGRLFVICRDGENQSRSVLVVLSFHFRRLSLPEQPLREACETGTRQRNGACACNPCGCK